ncbi:MAG TPA: hydrogenase maturation protease [Acidimicrobiales bacterium]|nr:hydrogenase maturation protease [Acidimicrobiales bacterium]
MTADGPARVHRVRNPHPMYSGVLVVGVGNPLRGDDGAGPAVAALAGDDPRLAGATVRRAVQLTPELAADVANASVVVVVDARFGDEPGAVDVARVAPAAGRPALSHHLDAGALAALTALAYGRVPPVYVVGIGASGFAAGAPLSDDVRAALPAALDAVAAIVAEC